MKDLESAIRQRKEKNDNKEKVKFSLFTKCMGLHIKKLNKSVLLKPLA
jgi:hypothetical protein